MRTRLTFPVLSTMKRSPPSVKFATGARRLQTKSRVDATRRHGGDSGARTLAVAQGNSLRALIMVLEKLTPEGILARELATGVPIIYRLDTDAVVVSKLDLAA